jgi:hypothetical protein
VFEDALAVELLSSPMIWAEDIMEIVRIRAIVFINNFKGIYFSALISIITLHTLIANRNKFDF